MVFEAAKLACANKTKELITSQKLGSHDFWQIANSLLNKSKSAIPSLFKGLKVLSSASDKAKSLAVNNSRTNLKLHNIPVSPKMVKKGYDES